MRRGHNYLAGAAAGVWLLIIAIPLYAMVSSSLKTRTDFSNSGPLALPTEPTLQNMLEVIASSFPRYLLNTAIVTVAVVALVVALVVPLAYVVVRNRGRAVSTIFRVFLLGLAIPVQAVAIPVFYLISIAGLYDNLIGVILPTAAFCLPVCTLVLSGAMRDVSPEMYEALALDGGGSFRAFWTLAVPLSRSGIATIVVYSALQAWNGFLFPLVLTQSVDTKTIPLGLFDFQTQFSVNMPALMSAVLLSTIPVLIVYLIARRSLVQGLMGIGGK
ncbi:carbohydrate ABC transporter permease [Glaciibacter superstes]|uniref:carbohydrate ABC transporter permease n=1 Tax=Glaciibacter superstes TaxID=501023 RepID=UPI0003B6B09E|nr:carbohydrate ABC transporter permease [Glaciibacter superstes]